MLLPGLPQIQPCTDETLVLLSAVKRSTIMPMKVYEKISLVSTHLTSPEERSFPFRKST